MKITECHQGNETAGCSLIDKNPGAITSMHSSAKSVPSAESMFSHSNTLQSSMSASFSRPSTSTALQAIYTHPTTASNNQTYMRDASMLTNQSSFGLRNASLPSQPNQPCYQPVQGASASMIFQTGDNVTHQSTDTLQRKVRNASGHSHSDQSDVNMFGSMGPSHSQSSRTSTHLDVTPTFSVSSITGYPSQSSRRNDSDSMPNRNLNHSYSQPTNTKQSSHITKGSTQQYPPSSSHNPVPPAKQCDYPFSSILTGLNDPVLSSSLSTNESRQSSNAPANPASSKKSLCIDKPLDKQYSTNTEGSSFKTSENSYNADYLTGKETERNFMPIIEDVRLTSEFSNDLFSSLQVPTGGAHADSISPTAAFLLAFPLVSTSKNAENPHDSDPQDNNTATPTTILQIGNIEPSNAEMFHPLEFGKDMEGHDYLGDLSDKCKRKENIFEKQKKPSNPFNSYSYPSMSGDYSIHYDQSWSDPKAKTGEGRKKNDKPKFCGNGSNYELCKDKKKKNKISVNWMAAPDVETFQKDQEASSFQANSFPMDIDPLPDLCSSKKANAYTWSPSKSLLPLDSALVIPSTLPTLVGDLALGTPTPVDSYKRCDVGKKQDKSSEKQNSQKAQSNFLSVSQLVDPKSKKKLSDKCKKADKKKAGPFPKRKDSSSGGSNEPCMYPDGFLPPLGWDKYRYRNNYSAEALIAMQDPNPNETVNFTYQQNSNYYVPSDVNQEHLQQSQQYQNSFNFSQNPSFSVDEYQNTSFSMNTGGSSASKRGGSDKRCREDASRFSARAPYQGHPPNQPVPSAPPSSHSSNFTSNTTTSVTNFNLSTIFPEINERTGSQSQTGPSQQHQQQHGPQSHSHNISSFQNPNGSTKYPTQHL